MMPVTISYDPRKVVDVLIEDADRRVHAQTQSDAAGWWLLIGGVRTHGPFATISHLREWVRLHVEQLLNAE